MLVGTFLAVAKRLVFNDPSFRNFLAAYWQNSSTRAAFSGYNFYRIELYTIGSVLLLLSFVRCLPLVIRVFKSWIHGIISGLTVAWAVPFSCYFCLEGVSLPHKLAGATIFASMLTLLSAAVHMRAASRSSTRLSLPAAQTTVARPSLEEHLAELETDSPIEHATQDLLGRSALVDSMASTILVSEAPVIALEGEYGDGKSSVLNLLRERLEGHAIVVFFKTWLPASERTLVRDLFSDISTECRRVYYVPQLRARLLSYAKTISGSISSLRGLSDLLPAASQRQEIAELAETLRRIPRRIVVLLDEIDRLQVEELRVLLKVIRGVTSFPNLSYVCAFSRTAIEKIHPKESAEALEDYYEKFFPVSYPLPKPEAEFLFKVFRVKLEKIFDSLNWFETQEEKSKFQKQLKNAWEDLLFKLCTNLRKTMLVVNDVFIAAVPISHEANALDLVLIETLRRFFPEIYKQVWRNAEAFMETNLSWNSRFYSEEQIKLVRKDLFARIIADLQRNEHSKLAADLLWWLFPSFADQYGQGVATGERRALSKDSDQAERDKRIFHEDFFSIYFRYQAPESIYSETELRTFILETNESSSKEQRKALFTRTLAGIPKGDPRRYSFVHRLLQSMARFNDAAAEDLAYAVAENASEYVYDSILPSVAEAGRGMLIVFEVAQRFAQSDKVQSILEGAIAIASDDTFALRLLTFSLNPGRNKVLKDFSNVRPDDLKRVFVKRMRNRYVENFEHIETSLAQADRGAFVFWADFSEEERQEEIAFWRRFVGTSRKRLARMSDILFPARTLWESDPRPHIERLFPLEELKALDEGLPNNEALEEPENRALNRMRRLIAGEFQHGVGFDQLDKL